MADRDVVERFAEIIGFGRIQYQERKQRPHHSPTYRWYVNGDLVEDLYGLISPWLGDRRKRRYAELLAERKNYEIAIKPTRYQGRTYLNRRRDPVTGRFLSRGSVR